MSIYMHGLPEGARLTVSDPGNHFALWPCVFRIAGGNLTRSDAPALAGGLSHFLRCDDTAGPGGRATSSAPSPGAPR